MGYVMEERLRYFPEKKAMFWMEMIDLNGLRSLKASDERKIPVHLNRVWYTKEDSKRKDLRSSQSSYQS